VETIASGEYPLSRPLFIYVSVQALEENPALEEFVTFYLAEENLSGLVEAANYVPQPDSVSQEVRQKVRGSRHGRRGRRDDHDDGRDDLAARQGLPATVMRNMGPAVNRPDSFCRARTRASGVWRYLKVAGRRGGYEIRAVAASRRREESREGIVRVVLTRAPTSRC
jgi:hypothetical protein